MGKTIKFCLKIWNFDTQNFARKTLPIVQATDQMTYPDNDWKRHPSKILSVKNSYLGAKF